MLILAYFAEGAVRAWSDHGLSAQLALAEIAAALYFFVACILYVRASTGRGCDAESTTVVDG